MKKNLAKIVSKESVLKALQKFEAEQPELRNSTKFDLEFNGNYYPPKEVIREAARQQGIEIDDEKHTLGGGDKTNVFLEKMGFAIVPKGQSFEINYNKFLPQIRRYNEAITTTDWLNVREIYKFNFIKWFEKNVSLENQSDLEIQEKIIASQQIAYSPGSNTKGLNFIQTIIRYQDDYITLADINLLREIVKGNKVVNETTSFSFGSYPKTSLFLSLFAPEQFVPYDNESAPAFDYLKLNAVESPKKGYKAFEFNQIFYSNIKSLLKNSHINQTLFKEILETNELNELHWNWITQDFLLFIAKNKMGFEETTPTTDNLKHQTMDLSLNQILYGPPGTGKTYATKELAITIAKSDFIKDLAKTLSKAEKRKAISEEYHRLCNLGQIVFTTFHQSMSYEDFMEGIKPKTFEGKVTYSVEDGIFKNSIKNAMAEYLEIEVQKTDDFDTLYNDFVTSLKPLEGIKLGTFLTKTGIEIMLVEANQNSIMVKYLWTNNKKESEGIHVFSVTKDKLKKILQAEIIPEKVKNLKTEIHSIVGHIHCELFAVYKSFYDFVIANKGEIETVHFDAKDMEFNDVNEQFLTLTKEEINSKKVSNHVLIIDEINRGNVSAIFGELITLLETDKRVGENEQILIKLPYSKKELGVPKNLYIIATMNTADRSVEALDTALRRRFSFVELMPDVSVVEEKDFTDYRRNEIMEKINNRIELLLDKNHTLGHAYFIKDNFKLSFENEIIPLLQEYFYNDAGKIGLVLGKGFVRVKEISTNNSKSIFADFESKNEVDVVRSYELIPFNEIDFKQAIETLLA